MRRAVEAGGDGEVVMWGHLDVEMIDFRYYLQHFSNMEEQVHSIRSECEKSSRCCIDSRKGR